MNVKTLLGGIALILMIGIAGFLYRNAVEHPSKPITCPLDAKLCPDGTSVGRTGSSCVFPACPPPNVELASLGISYAVPHGWVDLPATPPALAYYEIPIASSTDKSTITIESFPITGSSTAISVIHDTAVGGESGMPVPPTAISSAQIGKHRFSVVTIERFEGVVHIAYYLAREKDVLRFDAIDRGVDWTNPSLNTAELPANKALRELLSTL